MTTIAFRDGILAADSQVTVNTEAGGSTKHRCAKLFRKTIKQGRKSFDVIIATAGASSPGSMFVDWYGSGEPIPKMLELHGGDFTCLVLAPHGLYEVDMYCFPEPILDKFYAVGSGRKEALAAMHCGKSAREAVEIASRIDPYTGGAITTMTLTPKATKAKA